MGLSQQEYSIIKVCFISVGGITFIKSNQGSQKKLIITFDSFRYGMGVNKVKFDGIQKLNMDRVRRKMVLITMNRSECVKAVMDVHIINTGLQDKNQTFKPPGIVVLMMTMKG